MDCTRCPDYGECEELCPEAEAFASQDRVCYGKSGVIIQPRCKEFPNSSGNGWLEIMAYYNRHVEVPQPMIDMADFEHLMRFNFSKKQLTVILRYFIFGDSLGSIGRSAGISRQGAFNRLRSAVNVVNNIGERREMWDRIECNFDRLSGDEYKKHRLVLFFYFFEVLERQEIADKMNLSFQYICMLLNEACKLVDQKVDANINSEE